MKQNAHEVLAVPVARKVAALRAVVRQWRADGYSVALVPTMGALHEGHLSLVDLAATQADRVIVSLFVNPTQFAAHEDLDAYPRTETEDAEKLAVRACHLIYAPSADEVYPDGFATRVSVDGVGDGLESDHRPHFFSGVATVVAKLLLQAMPDYAVFGEKDYQQLLVVRRLVRDLDLPVEIVPGPTVREADGLAMSSRNAYLTAAQRQTAGLLNKVLAAVADQIRKGAPVAPTLRGGRESLLRSGFEAIDYLEVRDADTLGPLSVSTRGARLLIVARLGGIRLLDNMAI